MHYNEFIINKNTLSLEKSVISSEIYGIYNNQVVNFSYTDPNFFVGSLMYVNSGILQFKTIYRLILAARIFCLIKKTLIITSSATFQNGCSFHKRCENIVTEPRPVHFFIVFSEFSNFSKAKND